MPRPRAMRVCPTAGCPTLVAGRGRCPTCRHDAEQQRGTPTARGYGTTHRRTFRAAVLTRDPVCVVCERAPSTVADHWPRSRRDLVALELDPDDPQYGRGVCSSCHGKETAANPAQRGGWNAR